ncbi:NAD-dependent epimerase/dehydratase family protein, partial [Georgenia sp. 10Sc9-8]|nr:NAD-dependent epimerase/dehydratase family protein [Georgenia halotolerans]
MRVLVTGASGMLGRGVATALRDRGHEVTTLQRRASGLTGVRALRGSVTDPAVVARATTGQDAVVHLAAKVSFAGPEEEFQHVNVGGTEHLLTAARGAGAERFLFVSSPSVAHTGDAIVGEGAGPAQPARARGPYARTKAAAEVLALAADAPGFAVAAVRPHVVWGPGDTQLVERVVQRAAAGRLPLLDAGAALIDTTYVDNAVDALVAALERAEEVHGRALVVTNGEPRPVAELLAGMCGAAGVRAPSWHVPGRLARLAGAAVETVWRVRPGADEPPMTRFLAEQLSTAHWFDQRRTRELLRWQPRVTLDEG